MSDRLPWIACQRGIHSSMSPSLGSAPAATSACTTDNRPVLEAWCRAVRQWWSDLSMESFCPGCSKSHRAMEPRRIFTAKAKGDKYPASVVSSNTLGSASTCYCTAARSFCLMSLWISWSISSSSISGSSSMPLLLLLLGLLLPLLLSLLLVRKRRRTCA